MSMLAQNPALIFGLEAAVPLNIMEMRGLPFWERRRIAEEAGQVIASQGDVLQYGSRGAHFGHGAKQKLKHEAHGMAKAEACATCTRKNDSPRCCGNRFHDTCRVCLVGNPEYSAGEVFNFLARGLACAALQPGGITFAGIHWCAYRHPCCPSVRAVRRPACCTCMDACLLVTACSSPPEGSVCADACPFCANGCAAASDRPCCRTPEPRPAAVGEEPAGPPPDWRPDDEYGDLIEDVAVTGGRL